MNQKNNKGNNKLSADAKILDEYLSQYNVCIRNKRNLEKRRKNILNEFNTPLSSVNYSGMPRGGNKENLGCAALSLRLDDIDEKIVNCIQDAEVLLVDIMTVINELPSNTLERNVIEEKYIDNCNWNEITRLENISRSTAFYQWRLGLDGLLQYKRVRVLIEKFSEEKKAREKIFNEN